VWGEKNNRCSARGGPTGDRQNPNVLRNLKATWLEQRRGLFRLWEPMRCLLSCWWRNCIMTLNTTDYIQKIYALLEDQAFKKLTPGARRDRVASQWNSAQPLSSWPYITGIPTDGLLCLATCRHAGFLLSWFFTLKMEVICSS
jgi:hypothetical protein